jgi:nitroimidazol reductase NimA-like FMN-containing flavoprotein (pyridoxamine 5'-phosphate oxidase superfamily)
MKEEMMSVEDDHDGMQTLSNSECQKRVDVGGIGILALCGVSAPVLRPVNFVSYQGQVVIRTGEGQILQAAQGGEPASFVVSNVDRFEHTGWSVVVTGKLVEQSSLGSISDLPLRPWARAEKHRFVALSIDELSGRRISTEAIRGESSD